uniref:Uncharacterized protein n=1 Tax=Globodera pallida TaxID=36090 RepID=A0A183BQR5_GLOPA
MKFLILQLCISIKLLFAIIFALCKYRFKLNQFVPRHFIDVLSKTYALYMKKLERWFPDWQEMPFDIGAVYNRLKQTLTDVSKSTVAEMAPGDVPNLAKTVGTRLSNSDFHTWIRNSEFRLPKF